MHQVSLHFLERFNPLVNAGVLALIDVFGDTGSNRIQIYVCHGCQYRFVITQ